ncbi:CRISPR-associated helicase Cas3' [Exilibacterium tricleocarpae]|nr:CRISPR-associated helicase Cas3' [Exilibacterium tricleocarpae]
MSSKPYYRYWGKARPQSGVDTRYHLLPYHCLDVAACHQRLWAVRHGLLAGMAQYLGLPPTLLSNLLGFFATIHDIGKFSFVFQRLQAIEGAPLAASPERQGMQGRHDQIGYLYLRRWLRNRRDLPEKPGVTEVLELLGGIATGHHGIPPVGSRFKPHMAFTDEGCTAADSFLAWAWDFWQMDDCIEALAKTDISIDCWRAMSWVQSAMMILADWIGSDADVHNYCDDADQDLREYYQRAERRAAQQIDNLGLSRSPIPKKFSSAAQLLAFPALTPLQALCERVTLEERPLFFILEDITGAGKTEAVLVLVTRMLANDYADGFYFGLPTMATSDSLYERLQQQYEALYEPEPKPSLVLAHGATNLSGAFTESIGLPLGPEDQGEPAVHSATSWCNAFYADNKKKALLANVGVGTVDQALLAILQTRHQSLRLFGLLGKVLVLDEVHSYEGYTATLISELVQVHTRLGGSTIILSATLSEKVRQQLLDAFYTAQGQAAPKISPHAGYPWVTCAGHGPQSFHEIAVEPRGSSRRTVAVEPVYSVPELIEVIGEAIAKGCCVAWIRNTVKEAIASREELKNKLGLADNQIHLFHSRYAMGDRARIQAGVLRRFGKKSTGAQRRAQVVIATQVIEQSLDLDFDVLISDIAPIDLIIQRAGRLQRHKRDKHGVCVPELADDCRESPTLFVLMPDLQKVCDKNWLAPDLQGTGAVYGDWSNLWLTRQALLERGRIKTPEDSRWYMDAVYDKPSLTPPAELLVISDRQRADRLKGLALARSNRIVFEDGYRQGGNGNWLNETPTRLTEETTTVVLAEIRDERLYLLHGDMTHAWEMSSLTVRSSDLNTLPPGVENRWLSQITALKVRYKRQRSDDLVVPVVKTGDGVYEGTIVDINMKEKVCTYSQVKGLEIRPS